jgi:catechol 2,3-dioxygenase-like lactoylglutathione lyase family enzyme
VTLNPQPDPRGLPVSAIATDVTAKTHLSLNVADLGRSVEFYRVLFGKPPAKRHDDYAKFEVADPPIVLSLQPEPRPAGASLSHLGLRLPTAEMVAVVQRRLNAAGYETHRQDGVICGYARQSKAWVADPDRNWWEIYVLEEDVDPKSVGACLSELAPASASDGSAAESVKTWEHHFADPVPERLPYEDGTLDDARLGGTWNAKLPDDARRRLLAEVFRALKPGGKVTARGLVGSAFVGEPNLPGPAAVVKRVPLETELVRELAAAGFVGVHITKFGEAPYLTLGGVEMREQCLAAVKPLAVATGRTRPVLYKGSLARVTDADGLVFPRGVRVEVSDRTWESLLASPAAKDFLFAEPSAAPACNAH